MGMKGLLLQPATMVGCQNPPSQPFGATDMTSSLFVSVGVDYHEDSIRVCIINEEGVELATRRAIELRTMQIAVEYYEAKGYAVADTSQTEPYDLECRSGEEAIRVEVKGTIGAGEVVELTRNELTDEELDRVAPVLERLPRWTGVDAGGCKMSEYAKQRLTAIHREFFTYDGMFDDMTGQ
jgi:hypothetical protein